MHRFTSTEQLLHGFAEYPPIMTTEDVSGLLNLSVPEVRRLAREGVLPSRKVGRAYRYFRDEIVLWLDGLDSKD